MWLVIVLLWLLIWAGGTYWYLFGKKSPFALESVRPPGPREFDQKKRDKVIKQGKTCTPVKDHNNSIIFILKEGQKNLGLWYIFFLCQCKPQISFWNCRLTGRCFRYCRVWMNEWKDNIFHTSRKFQSKRWNLVKQKPVPTLFCRHRTK